MDRYLVRILNKKLMNTRCVKCLSEGNYKFISFVNEFQCLKGVISLLMDLECPLLRGSSVLGLCRRAATLPFFGKDIPISSFRFILRRGDGGRKKNPPALVTGIKTVVIYGRVRRLLAIKSADINRGRQYP